MPSQHMQAAATDWIPNAKSVVIRAAYYYLPVKLNASDGLCVSSNLDHYIIWRGNFYWYT
jgi:hypothetical protein